MLGYLQISINICGSRSMTNLCLIRLQIRGSRLSILVPTIFLSCRQLLASVLFSLAIVLALAQTDIVCNNTAITKDCTQFITKFCADVASVEVSSSLSPRPVHITHLVILMVGQGLWRDISLLRGFRVHVYVFQNIPLVILKKCFDAPLAFAQVN